MECMEAVRPPQSIVELPLDIIKLVGTKLGYLSSRQFMRLLLLSKKPCVLIECLPELEFPAHLTQRRSALDSLRVGPFFTRQAAIDLFWTLPCVKSLRHLNLSYMNFTKPILQVLDACAPTLVTLRLTGSSGSNKFWETQAKFPNLRVLDCWGFTFPSQKSVDAVLNFVMNQCGEGLKEFHMSGNLPSNSSQRIPNRLAPCQFQKLTRALLPHRNTLEFIRVRTSIPSVNEFTESLKTFISIKMLEYPLTIATVPYISNGIGEVPVQLQACLDWIDSFSRQISEAKLSKGFSIHSLVESVAPDATIRCHTYGLYDVLLRRIGTCGWPLFSGIGLEFFTNDLPKRGFRPSAMSYATALEFQAREARTDQNIRNPYEKRSKPLLEYFAVDCCIDATVPLSPRTGATAFHLGLSCQSLRKAFGSSGVTLPKWLENSAKIARLRDLAGRIPLMYYRIRMSHLREVDSDALEIRDHDGNSVFHYVMAESPAIVSTSESHYLGLILETLNYMHPVTAELALNNYGVSPHSLLAGPLAYPQKVLTNMAPLPHTNESYWSCISVEEPIFTRLIGMRVRVDELHTSPLVPLLKQVFQTASRENLNAQVYGPNFNLPFMHAAIDAEALWIFKVLQEIPDTWSLIDMNALDYMGRTALHIAVQTRKDPRVPAIEWLKILLPLGMLPTIPDKNGWTVAMRVSDNSDCYSVISGYLTDQEKKHQSALLSAKRQGSKVKSK